MSTVITFAGLSPTSGGTGKDTFAVNTATWLAKVHGKSVVVVDLDLHGNLKKQYGATSDMTADELTEHVMMTTTLTSEKIRQILPKFHSLGFWLLPTFSFDYADEKSFQHMKELLSWTFDVVIFNLPSALRSVDINAVRQSDIVFLVGTDGGTYPEGYIDGLNAYKSIVRGEMKIVINRGFDDESNPTVSALRTNGYPIFVHAMEDEKVFTATREGKAVVLTNPTLSFSYAVQKVGKEILKLSKEHMAAVQN